MAASPEFIDLLADMKAVHESKSADYAQDDNPFSNFEYSATVGERFTDPVDRVFATMIGIKLARLAELLSNGKTPKNESIDDTMKDGTVYWGLWTAYHRKKRALA